MCANKLKLWICLQVEKQMYTESRKNSRTEKYDTLFCELSSTTHIFLLLTDNFYGLNEAGHVVTTRFQSLTLATIEVSHIRKLSCNRFLYPIRYICHT